MTGLIQQVTDISPDELALGLVEADRTPPGKGKRRFQMIEVIRNDRRAQWVYDLGPAESFHAHGFHIPSGEIYSDGRIDAWHTVAELREIADEWRESKKDDMFDPAPSMDWTQAYQDEMDRQKREARKISIFGHGFSKMRY